MSYPFKRTLRSLSGDEFGIRVTLVSLSVSALVGLLAWAALARIPVLKVSTLGRIEPHNAVHRIEPPESGKVLRSTMALDKEVAAGELLIEFDTHEQRLELEQSKITKGTLTRDLAALEEQIARKKIELSQSSLADEAALREAEARSRELGPRFLLAQQRQRRAEQSAPGVVSELEKLERKTEQEELSRTIETQPIAIQRVKRDQLVRRSAIESQLLQLRRDQGKLRGELEMLEVSVARLNHQIERRMVRAEVSGQLVDVVELASGAYTTQGQRLGTILAKGELRVRARLPKETVGIVRPGQPAQLKLDGYPWSVYGKVPAKVTSIGTEPTVLVTPEAVPGTVRVEFEILPAADSRIKIQHGMTATVEVEVARVSPFILLLRALGEWNYGGPATPAPGSPEAAELAAQNAQGPTILDSPR